jgi:hypothetical protein
VLLLLEIRRKRGQLGLDQLILLVGVVSNLMMEAFLVYVSCELGDLRTHLLNGEHFRTTIHRQQQEVVLSCCSLQCHQGCLSCL